MHKLPLLSAYCILQLNDQMDLWWFDFIWKGNTCGCCHETMGLEIQTMSSEVIFSIWNDQYFSVTFKTSHDLSSCKTPRNSSFVFWKWNLLYYVWKIYLLNRSWWNLVSVLERYFKDWKHVNANIKVSGTSPDLISMHVSFHLSLAQLPAFLSRKLIFVGFFKFIFQENWWFISLLLFLP